MWLHLLAPTPVSQWVGDSFRFRRAIASTELASFLTKLELWVYETILCLASLAFSIPSSTLGLGSSRDLEVTNHVVTRKQTALPSQYLFCFE